MKVLWFTNTSSLYDRGNHLYNGGGWIESLQQIIEDNTDVELAVSFFHQTDSGKIKKSKTTYYPILKKKSKSSPIQFIINNWVATLESGKYLKQLTNVIDDFKPDIIHIFGTEGLFASLQGTISIPVVIHLQGLVNPILNSYFPPGQSRWNFFFNSKFLKNNILGTSDFFNHKRFVAQAIREDFNLKSSRFVAGRTQWDNSLIKILAPNAKYFHIDEVLRPCFYSCENSTSNNNVITIVSTLSSTIYKGIDVVLKTAKLLKQKTNIKFEWRIVGVNQEDKLFRYFESVFNVSHRDVNIECMGMKTPEELSSILVRSNLFIHPSYIDNSPNSVCEAQLIGLLVIACNVGGLPSIIEHEVSGVLVPSNGIYEIVATIKDYSESPDKYLIMAKEGRKVALKRHDRNKISSDVNTMYNNILNNY